MPKKPKKQKKSPKKVAVDILRSAKGSRLKKRVVVEVKKKVKKPPMVKFSTDGVTLTKQEMKFYEKMLGKVPLDYRDRGIEDRDSKVIEAEERAILGDTYDKVMREDPKPMSRAEHIVLVQAINNGAKKAPTLPPQDPTRDFGVLGQVAESYGIEKKAFEKLMEFLVSAEVISWGDIVNYKMSLKEFIEAKREEKREAERKKEEAQHAAEVAAVDAAVALYDAANSTKKSDVELARDAAEAAEEAAACAKVNSLADGMGRMEIGSPEMMKKMDEMEKVLKDEMRRLYDKRTPEERAAMDPELVEEFRQADEKAKEINKMVETWENTNTKNSEE